MKLFLSMADIPELSTFSTAERRRIMRTCLGRALRRPRFWLIFLVPNILFYAVCLTVLFYMRERFDKFTLGCIAFLTVMTIDSLLFHQYYYRFMLPYVRELLPGFCSSCGYNLSGNTSGVCPECGTEK